jgi:hypothetical protein
MAIKKIRDSIEPGEKPLYSHGTDKAGERDVRNAGIEEVISLEVSVVTAILEVET